MTSISYKLITGQFPLINPSWLQVCAIARDARKHNRLGWLLRLYPDIEWMKAIDNNIYISSKLKGGD